MGAGWDPLVLVSGHWADVRVSVCWEPDAGTGGHVVAVQGGFHRWSVVDVAAVRGRDAKTVPHG